MSLDLAANPAPYEIKSVDLEVVDRLERRTKLGRPARLTLRRFLALCHDVERGWSIVKAAEAQGVTYRALRRRVAQSPRLQERLKEAGQIRFNLRVEKACESLMKAGEQSWMAHAWFLERSLPHLFALRNVNRPGSEQDESEEPLPAEIYEHHKKLMLELLREDSQRSEA
jgi:hypothetical protein